MLDAALCVINTTSRTAPGAIACTIPVSMCCERRWVRRRG